MKINHPQHRRAFVALVPTLALIAMPAMAQDAMTAPPVAAQTVVPPPVVPTVTSAPPPVTVAPPVVQAAPAPVAAPVEAAPVPRAVRPRADRPVPARIAPRAAPVAAVAPVAETPAPIAPAPVPVEEIAPVAAAPVETAPADTSPTGEVATDTNATNPAPSWPWIVAGIVALLAIVGGLMMRRRRRDDMYDDADYAEPAVASEPAFVEPVRAAPVIAPVPQFISPTPVLAASPAVAMDNDSAAEAVAVEAELADADDADVAALTAGEAPAGRPWLELAMRPVRAGSNADDALVEIELTVGNSGSVAARDVRISTFMFASEPASAAEIDRLLVERVADAVEPVTIEPGEGTRVDATLSLPREYLDDEARSFSPVVVADARYTLPDGSEGRTSASFSIGMPNNADDNAEMRPIAIHRPQMSDDVEARLHGVPEHA